MNILLSAYACEPNKGSEPGVGWNWAIELAKLGHQVYVITRANNEPVITAALEETPYNNLDFIYYDVPRWLMWWKKGGRGVRFYYLLWQIGIFKIVQKYHEKIKFDVVHHITFGVVRQPSFIGKLGVPFILGPLGGGERAPYSLRVSYPLRGKVFDLIRDVMNYMVKIDPFMLYTFSTASKIYVKTPQSKDMIPKCFHKKTTVHLEIGVDKKGFLQPSPVAESESLRVLYVGRFVYWKGGHLVLLAFSKLLKCLPDARLTMVGKGSEEEAWKRLAKMLGINRSINWIQWVNQDKLTLIYANHDVLLFPSLHDSSGNVVLESFAYGLPVVCLDLGGPSEMVDITCGYKVQVKARTETQVVDDLSEKLVHLANNPDILKALSCGAIARAAQKSWKNTVASLYTRNLLMKLSVDQKN